MGMREEVWNKTDNGHRGSRKVQRFQASRKEKSPPPLSDSHRWGNFCLGGGPHNGQGCAGGGKVQKKEPKALIGQDSEAGKKSKNEGDEDNWSSRKRTRWGCVGDNNTSTE